MGLKRKLRLDAEELYVFAVRALGTRAYSTADMRRKLVQRAERPEDVPGVIARLKEHRFLDDQGFAAAFASARLENQGFGKARVLRDLAGRRVQPAIAQQAVEKTFEGRDETALVEAYLARKYRNIDLGRFLAEEKNLASAYRRLRHAGFSSGTSVRVLKRHAERAGELEALEDETPPES
jgi:regulatory protein